LTFSQNFYIINLEKGVDNSKVSRYNTLER